MNGSALNDGLARTKKISMN